MALSNLDFMNVDETSQWALETLGGVSNRRREVSTEPYHPHSQALKDLVGTYIQGIPEEFHEITFQHGQLYIFYPKYFTEPCPLVPVSSDVFHFQPSFLQESLLLTVLRDDNHEVWAIDLLPGIYVKEGYDSWAAPRDLLDAN